MKVTSKLTRQKNKWAVALLSLLLTVSLSVQGADLLVRDVFKQMPDSVMPYLSANNRLDFIDYMDSGMKAEISNQFGGTSEMTALTDDSLSIRLSKALRVDILLVTPAVPVDSFGRVVCMVETFGTDSLSLESVVRFYTPDWRPLLPDLKLSRVDQRRVDALEVQTILKWEDEILKKD